MHIRSQNLIPGRGHPSDRHKAADDYASPRSRENLEESRAVTGESGSNYI